MRLLFVLPNFPFPPHDGARTKIFNILKYLSPRHQCDLLCFGESSSSDVVGLRKSIQDIGSVWVVPPPSPLARFFYTIMNLLVLRPPSFGRYASCSMARHIKIVKKNGRYDAVHFDIINMAPYLRYCRDLPSLHSPNDATSLVYYRLFQSSRNIFSRIRLHLVSKLLARYESANYANFSKIHVVSTIDRDYLAAIAPDALISVVPITSGYPRNISDRYIKKIGSCYPSIVICGDLRIKAIAEGFEDFINLVLPDLLREYPTLRVRVLSRKLSISGSYARSENNHVEYFSGVDNFEEFLSNSDILVLLDKAGAPGPKTRTVQAMAIGLPVVGTFSAFEGIPMVHLRHGVAFSTFEDCRDILIRLLSDPQMRETIGANAAQLAADKYSIESVGPRYEAIYSGIAVGNRSKIY